MNATILLKALSLLQAGFNLATIVAEIHAKKAAGATDEDINNYIDDLFEQAAVELNETN